jgi:hypothetical protein
MTIPESLLLLILECGPVLMLECRSQTGNDSTLNNLAVCHKLGSTMGVMLVSFSLMI